MPAITRVQPAYNDPRPALDRPTLTLDELEVHDPHATARGTERRFLCPLPTCGDKQRGAQHRSLALNVETGAWTCHRCHESGKLRERWTPRRDRERVQLRKAFGLRPPAGLTLAMSEPLVPPTSVPAAPTTWHDVIGDVATLTGSPGAAYLAGRGIPAELIDGIDAMYSPDYYGRPSILFRVRDRAGRVVALMGRYVDGRDDPKGRDAGKKSLGVFATAGARTKTGRLAITEAPIDALSLAAAGVPAIALGGTTWPAWLPSACAFRPVVLALDADEAGDAGCVRLARALQAYGAKVERWRPSGGKDWNELLLTLGRDALASALGTTSPEPPASKPAPVVPPMASQAPSTRTWTPPAMLPCVICEAAVTPGGRACADCMAA